ncbi:MAG: dihydropteroate synthase [Chloroflexota bacterium]|jgi:dihydropteroate synthase
MRRLDFGKRTYIMGILNITPDSFSGDGLLRRQDALQVARRQALEFVAAGADILDIGGESTRPGSQPVSVEEEKARVLPVIEMLASLDLDVILSIDTYKADVAEAALRAGADWINDVWALRADSRLAQVAARHNCPLVLMHNRSKPTHASLQERLGGRYIGMQYTDLIPDICRELMESVALAHQAGIPNDNIILDPGIGFGKTVEQNLEILRRLDEIKALGFPLLLGVSRKSFIGYTLDSPPDQRLEGSLAAGVIGITRGADILRVHDVPAAARAARMADAILHPK